MKPVRSYLIRIYRRDAQALAGLVENVRTGHAAPFRSLTELCDLLSGRKPFPRRRPIRRSGGNAETGAPAAE